MSKRRQSQYSFSPDSQETFRFDSKASLKSSKHKTNLDMSYMNVDLSQRTSEIIREAEFRNQNILELLQESDEEKKTLKGDKQNKSELWEFFAKFQKQSNPNITISQIQLPKSKPKKMKSFNRGPLDQKEPKQIHEKKKPNKDYKKIKPRMESYQKSLDKVHNENDRYPKRHRLQPLKYWLGQKCVYKNGQIINVIKISKD